MSNRSWARRVLLAAAALQLLFGVFAVRTVAGAGRAPSFRRGGKFAGAAGPRPFPYTPAPADPAFATTTSTPSGATTVVASAARPAASGPAAAGSRSTPAAAASSSLPALASYRYSVTGTESATGFGSRSFPSTATMRVHAGPGLAANEVVFDLTLSSQHEEREIVAFDRDAASFTFEGGSVTFGSATQTSQATYDPSMTQVLLDTSRSRSGSSTARNGDGSVSRIEDWTVTRGDDATVVIAGQSIRTEVFTIHRQTRPGSADQLTRSRTYWYDPSRHLWVKWEETMHGARKMFGLTFTYDNHYVATLTS